jgi:hypothetical protein
MITYKQLFVITQHWFFLIYVTFAIWKISKYKPVKVDKSTISLEKKITTQAIELEEAVLGHDDW